MNKSLSRTLIATGVLAFAAVAQAGTTGSGETSMTPTTNSMGSMPQVATTPDLNTMGAGPAVSVGNTTYYTYPQSHLFPERRDGATGTFNVPGRAGEASTMTNGVPNQETSNYSPPVSNVVVVPYTVTN
jgi:hypothetical protein